MKTFFSMSQTIKMTQCCTAHLSFSLSFKSNHKLKTEVTWPKKQFSEWRVRKPPYPLAKPSDLFCLKLIKTYDHCTLQLLGTGPLTLCKVAEEDLVKNTQWCNHHFLLSAKPNRKSEPLKILGSVGEDTRKRRDLPLGLNNKGKPQHRFSRNTDLCVIFAPCTIFAPSLHVYQHHQTNTKIHFYHLLFSCELSK